MPAPEAARRLFFAGTLLAAAAVAEPDGESLTIVQDAGPAPLPEAVTNNAVASVKAGRREYIVSFNGLGAGKTHADTLASTYVYDSRSRSWSEADPVPGDAGRLASAAAPADRLVFVFGGYTVADDGTETSTSWTHAFDPRKRTFEERAPMPVPVDDAVAVTYDDRYIYLVSGWHDVGNVNLVQRYDTRSDAWVQATPIPGPAVFGHAGGIVGNTIVYCDGVAVAVHDDRPRDFVTVPDCYLGIIDNEDARRIDWRSVDYHPGLPRYRMAAAGVAEENGVLFVGGSENPYNYNGMGYDGQPSEPAAGALLFDIDTQTWQVLEFEGEPTMDHRGLVPFAGQWLTVGGMAADQQVTRRVAAYELD
ncbi:MAG TPA: kelch repeat-containing protein [Woeseiaceae bacterium]|nr:kelch repeat-containing protein [Woeseiaceae bacterium]